MPAAVLQNIPPMAGKIKTVNGGLPVEPHIHGFIAQAVFAAPTLGLDGEIRWFLHFKDETARADGVNHAGRHKEHVACPDRTAIDECGHCL